MFYGTNVYVCRLDNKGRFAVPIFFLTLRGSRKIKTLYFTAEETLCVYLQIPSSGSHKAVNCSFSGKFKIPHVLMEQYDLKPDDEISLRDCDEFFAITKLKYFPIHSPGLKASLQIQSDSINEHSAAEIQSITIENEPKLTADELRPFCGLLELTIKNCGLRDISFLEAMPQIRHLDISGNPIRSTRQLSVLKSLETLTAIGCGIGDIDFIKELPAIKELYLDRNSITNLVPLKNMHDLRVLHFTENYVNCVSELLPLKSLTEVKFSGNRISKEDREELLLHIILNNHKTTVLWEAAYIKKRKSFMSAYGEEMEIHLLSLLFDLIFVRRIDEVLFEDEHRYTANVTIDTKPLTLAVENVIYSPYSWKRQRTLQWMYRQNAVKVPIVIDYLDSVSPGRPGTMRFFAAGGGFIGPGEHYISDNSQYTEVNFFEQLMPPEAIGMLYHSDFKKVLWEKLRSYKWEKLESAFVNLFPMKEFNTQDIIPAVVERIPPKNICTLYNIAICDDNEACAELALEKISDDFVLAVISENYRRTKKAVSRIKDQTMLVCLALCLRHSHFIETLLERITDQNELFNIAMKSFKVGVSVCSVDYINDLALLEKIAKESKESQVRVAAIGRISDENVLYELAIKYSDEYTRLTAIEGIQNCKLLGQLLKSEKDQDFKGKLRDRIFELARKSRGDSAMNKLLYEIANSYKGFITQEDAIYLMDDIGLLLKFLGGKNEKKQLWALRRYSRLRCHGNEIMEDQPLYCRLAESSFRLLREEAAALIRPGYIKNGVNDMSTSSSLNCGELP